MAKPIKFTAELKRAFIEGLRSGKSAWRAYGDIGISHHCAYDHRKKDEKFAEEWKEAALIGSLVQLSEAEREIRRRAIEGVEEPVFHRGEICGHIQKYSDTLLIFMTKALARRAGDNSYVERQDITSNDKTIPGVVVVGEAAQTVDDWEERFGAMKSPDAT